MSGAPCPAKCINQYFEFLSLSPARGIPRNLLQRGCGNFLPGNTDKMQWIDKQGCQSQQVEMVELIGTWLTSAPTQRGTATQQVISDDMRTYAYCEYVFTTQQGEFATCVILYQPQAVVHQRGFCVSTCSRCLVVISQLDCPKLIGLFIRDVGKTWSRPSRGQRLACSAMLIGIRINYYLPTDLIYIRTSNALYSGTDMKPGPLSMVFRG